MLGGGIQCGSMDGLAGLEPSEGQSLRPWEKKKMINELRNGRSNGCKAEMEEKECEARSFWRSPDS